MSRQEILTEIKRLHREIALQPFGEPKIEHLQTQLILMYTEYVKLIEGKREKRVAA